MIVFFVSECRKKSRKRSARILDAFAERIGKRTWKTRITLEGLKSLKILLSREASRNTAVACHRVVGYNNTKLLWVIGNRKKFNRQGIIPTNFAKINFTESIENDWHCLEALKICTALAALFHDWGKAWDAFQEMLRGESHSDYIRHEYVSLILWASFVRKQKPEKWIEDLRVSNLNEKDISEYACSFDLKISPFEELKDPLSRLIGWLIVSHHLLPHPDVTTLTPCDEIVELMKQIRSDFGLEKSTISNRSDLKFSRGLPCRFVQWKKEATKWAKRAQKIISKEGEDLLEWEEIMRPLSSMARTALMIGDHEASAKAESDKKTDEKSKFSPTNNPADIDKKLWAKSLKQGWHDPITLEDHLLDVTRTALSFCHIYPYIESHLGYVEEAESLERKSTGRFAWQDRAAEKISKEINEPGVGAKGFFGINASSTGTGKTYGNGKIMKALNGGRLRYTLALGLRSLTLQTGDEYRERIGLDETELGVLIGSKATRDLHDSLKTETLDDKLTWDGYSGFNEINYSSILDEKLSTKLSNDNANKLLYSPILVCTIDHIMSATEGVRRGHHIISWLRMLSSDLVIDEIDDFAGDDLIAIFRLIHLAGMLGKNVLLSSATIPPSVAKSAFDSYQNGWKLFAKIRGKNQEVLCAWIDELCRVKTECVHDVETFGNSHKNFIQNRIKKLNKQIVKRKAEIISVQKGSLGKTVVDAACLLHERHGQLHNEKKISFGVIRMANITPCVSMARYLLNSPLPSDTAIRILTYHSRFPRIIRHNIERELDMTLKRKDPLKVFDFPTINKHLKKISEKNVLFIVVATPVEEVGRDHDFDWAIIEPSSIRSLIQMAGRVLRHREPNGSLNDPNIILLSHNVRAILNDKKIAYNRPGYESSRFSLDSHDLQDLVDRKEIAMRVDATPRIFPKKDFNPKKDLADLEHACLHHLLVEGNVEDYATVPGWIHGPYHLVDVAQQVRPFRKNEQEVQFFLCPEEPSLRLRFYVKNDDGKLISKDHRFIHAILNDREKNRLWFSESYHTQLETIGDFFQLTTIQAAKKFGGISFPEYVYYSVEKKIMFNPSLGAWQEKNLDGIFG